MHPRLRRIAWFIALWAAGVLALAGVAALLRMLMRLAGEVS